MLAALKELIPGAEAFMRLMCNRSEQFEARFSLVEIVESKSILLTGMQGSLLPIAVAHGEERMDIVGADQIEQLRANGQLVMRFVDHGGHATDHYPENPNGSLGGVTGLCSADGRVTI